MKNPLTRRGFLSSAAAFTTTATAALAAPPTVSLRPVLRGDDHFKRAVPEVEEILRSAKLSGRVCYAVADAGSGTWLECGNENVGTPPASVTKAVTALYALDVLGPDHRFDTQLAATGGIKDAVVQGDLVLIGGGDPTLDTDRLAEMAAALKAAGITGVKGGFKVYQGALPVLDRIDPAQPDQVGYNPGVSGIALNYNRVHFEWKRSDGNYAVTMDGRSEKYRPDVTFAAMRIEDRAAPVYTYHDQNGRDQWTVARGALGGSGARWLPVRKPALYAGEVFATLAGAQGIRLPKPEVIADLPEADTVIVQQSAPLRAILHDMLKYSTNLTAEMVGLSATRARLGAVSDLASSAAEMNRWAAATLGMQGPGLVDHSGLGDNSTLTVVDMARALLSVRDREFRSILKPFGFRDAKGRPVKDQAIQVDAKTGTLNFVSTLAGYITTQEGRELVFAIFTADPQERLEITRAERESPPGAQAWNQRAKRVQQALIERWDALYGKTET